VAGVLPVSPQNPQLLDNTLVEAVNEVRCFAPKAKKRLKESRIMSMFPPIPPSNYQFSERIVELTIERLRRDRQSSRASRPRPAEQSRSEPWYRDALAGLGCRLATWGAYLQERFSSGGTACGPQPAKPPVA
jgi:hypothetical protein